MTDPGPAVSIMMPTYNPDRAHLRFAVDSALSQMREDDELLLQDGGSDNGSLEAVLAEFGDRPQLKVVSAKDEGQADALNKALARAVNPVIGWTNGDDCMEPGALDVVRREWVRDPSLDVVYGSWRMFDNAGTVKRIGVPGTFDPHELTLSLSIYNSAMYTRADVLRRLGGFDKSLYFCMDMDLLMRVAQSSPHVVKVPEVLGGFRWHTESKTGAYDLGLVRESIRIRRRYAHGLRAHAWAFGCTGVQLVVMATLPIRKSEWYSRRRVARARARGAEAHGPGVHGA